MATPEQGVNQELGNDLSKVLYEAAKQTWVNRQGRFGEVDERHAAFSGFRGLRLDLLTSMEGLIVESGSDGVGTKIEIAERTRNHRTPPFDLLAMGPDDRARWGAEPIFATVTLDTRKLEDIPSTRQAIAELAQGTIEAAREADIVIVGGETDELGARVGGYAVHDSDLNYNLAVTVVGLVHESRVITGHDIKPGDSLIGLVEKGFRSNGISKVREILRGEFGEEWHDEPFDELTTMGEAVQTPSTIYCKFINLLTGGYDIQKPARAEISGIAHITQGGMPEKLRRMLDASGYGAVITNPLIPPEIMSRVQELGQIPDREALMNWHMGPGMVIATPKPDEILELAERKGIMAQEIGEVVRSRVISIRSPGVMEPWRPINFFI